MVSCLLWLSVSVLLVTASHGKIPVMGTLLYYKDSQLYTFLEAMKFCSGLGGDAPHDLDEAAVRSLLPTLNDFDVGYWLDVEHGRGGYRWDKTGSQVPADLWDVGEPNCDARVARLGCRVSMHAKTGRLFAHSGTDRMHALCAVNFTDPEAVAKLRSKAPTVMMTEDRIEVERILIRYEVTGHTSVRETRDEQRFEQLEKKVDAVAKLVQGLVLDLQASGAIFPIIRHDAL